jgi:hypothetical protein
MMTLPAAGRKQHSRRRLVASGFVLVPIAKGFACIMLAAEPGP